MAVAPPTSADPSNDEVIAHLCGQYLDHLNGSGDRSRAELASIPLATCFVRRPRETLDQMEDLYSLVQPALRKVTKP